MNWLLAQLFAPIAPIVHFVGDHRYGVIAVLALAASIAVRVYFAPEGQGFSKLLFWLAIGFGCFDWGYSHRAAIDRETWARAESARLAAELAEHARREDVFAKARDEAAAEARAQAMQEADREKILKESEHASQKNDNALGLPAASVLRLNRLR